MLSAVLNPLSHWLATAIPALAALFGVFFLYTHGQSTVAAATLGCVCLVAWIYLSPRTHALRYLFPGIAAAVVFVLFPLLYTVQIGFTNFSSKNLLSFERSTQYLLDETTPATNEGQAFTLHADGPEYRLLLRDDNGRELVSAPLALKNSDAVSVELQPLDNARIALQPPLPLGEVIRLQAALKKVSAELPDGAGNLSMSSLRQFAPVEKTFKHGGDDTLINRQSGETFRPNWQTGFYENERGDRVGPGFKVGVGWANFQRIFVDPAFREPFARIFGWTVIFSALTVLFTLSVGIVLAVLLNWEALRGRALYRTLLFLPYAVPGFISILVFKGLFNNSFGEINLILDALFGIKPAWFSDPLLAKAMLLIVNTWLGYPYMMVICMGLIKAIPSDLYEASAIAGAGPLTNFFRITLPLIIRPLTPLLIAAFAFNFNNFVLISLLTGGRPDFIDSSVPAGTTDLLVSYTYRIAFEDSGQDFGLAAAISTVIFLIIAVLSIINLRLTGVARTEKRA